MTAPIGPKQIEQELTAARAARERGNEGMARVCARRAAGWAVGWVRSDSAPTSISGNAYQLLRWYSAQEEEPSGLRRAAKRLTVRITEDHTLPHPEDPLEDAEQIVEGLLPGGARAGEETET